VDEKTISFGKVLDAFIPRISGYIEITDHSIIHYNPEVLP